MSPTLTIIGSGLAGLALAQSLLDHGVEGSRITLIDAGDERRASDVPGTLMHPFPGRSMKPKRGQLESAKTSVDFLRRLRDEAPKGAVIELAMARPLEGEFGERLEESWREAKEGYPDWFDSRIVSGEELQKVDKNLAGFEKALVYTPAFSVNTQMVRRHLRERFRDQGVELVDNTTVERLEREQGRWRLVSPTGAERLCERVVLAIGAGLASWFPGLPIRGRGGEVLIVEPPEGEELNCIINRSGHVAPIAGMNGDAGMNGKGVAWSAGSTYWSPEEFAARTDEQAIADLRERCAPLVPALTDARPLRVGRGVRAMYRGDNRPLVGRVPTFDDLYVFGALGSKGLLRIPELADQLSLLLLDRGDVDKRANTARVKVDKWQNAPRIS